MPPFFKERTFCFCHPSISIGVHLDSSSRQEQFFLACSIRKMGGVVVPFLSSLESTLASHLQTQKLNPDTSFIICPYLKPGQRRRVEACLGDVPIPIVSSYWLYACIDHCTCLSLATSNPYDRVLFTPGLRFRNEGENEQ